MAMGNIKTFITFRSGGAEAVEFYTSLIPNSKITSIYKHPGGGPIPEGSLLNASFELDGQKFMAMDGGNTFSFAEGTSILVNVETQAELDRIWDAFTAEGGEPGRCGWLKDRWGMSWQIVPEVLGRLLSGPDRARSGRVVQAMLKMNRLIISDLENA